MKRMPTDKGREDRPSSPIRVNPVIRGSLFRVIFHPSRIGPGELGIQFSDKARHFFLAGFAVVLDFLGTHKPPRSQHVAVAFDFFGFRRVAESCDVRLGDLN